MRMWMVKPKFLCRKHLFGEHVECHMFKGTILMGKSIQGYLDNQLVLVGSIKKRHDELVKEIIRRGYNHKSPMKKFDEGEEAGFVDSNYNLKELKLRCEECKKLQ